MSIRTRFSPSPTGMIHIGNARAALFSALFAAKNNGVFILRIEDTDLARSDARYVDALQDDLRWMDIYWQEGPGVDGGYGPYWQSQRQNIYADYYQILEEKGLIYPCFCTDQELALARKLQLSRGHAPRYAGTCRKLSAAQIADKIAAGTKPAWRFAVPSEETITFTDIVKGPQSFATHDIGDFIVRRADGTAPFLFCNAIDDATMKVTHVLRGEDHLANTPRQIMILSTLKLHTPQYGHLSLIVGDDGAPLSKRHGSSSVHEMRAEGYLPIALMNYLARLGHTFEGQELLSFAELAPHFQLEKLSRSPARFDRSQLLYWQKTAAQALDVKGVWDWLGDHIMMEVPENKRTLFAETIRANIEFPQDATQWVKIFFNPELELNEEGLKIIREAGEQFFVEAEQAVIKYQLDLPKIFAEMKQTLNVSGKKLFMPLRVALTGQTHGPEFAHIVELLGVQKTQHRLGKAIQLAASTTGALK
jgi:glutamyl-tRNA synthetase